jgi:peptidoglycan/LPS O-acetylase OafA/YrhL
LSQIWFFDVHPLSNAPFWSLCYEWLYYVAFGCFALVQGRKRWFLGLAALAVMGPRILLLFPVWLLGVAVYRWRAVGRRLPAMVAVALFLSPIGLVGIFALDDSVPFNQLSAAAVGPHLFFPNMFIFAIMFGFLFALNLLSFSRIERYLAPVLATIEMPIRWVAGSTLSLYLYHFPLLLFFGAIFRIQPTSPFWMNAALLLCTLACCLALSSVTEAKKRLVQAWIEAVFARILALHRYLWATHQSKRTAIVR